MTDERAVVHPLALELQGLADRTARQVLDVLAHLEAGTITPAQLPELVAVLVKLGGDQAAALVVGELVRELELAGARPHQLPPLAGLTGHVQAPAVERAVATVMAGDELTRRSRLERLARSAVARAGQDARGAAVRSSPAVAGWTRGVDSDSCQLCVWWWREGRVWPKTHHMPRHPGCTCVQVPALARGLRGVSDEAYADSTRRRELERRGEYLQSFGTDRRSRERTARRVT